MAEHWDSILNGTGSFYGFLKGAISKMSESETGERSMLVVLR